MGDADDVKAYVRVEPLGNASIPPRLPRWICSACGWHGDHNRDALFHRDICEGKK